MTQVITHQALNSDNCFSFGPKSNLVTQNRDQVFFNVVVIHFSLHVLTKGSKKFDCLIKEMLFIRKLKSSLNVQADSIRAKVFT